MKNLFWNTIPDIILHCQSDLGMLLYAKTEEEIQPDNVYQMHGSQISVKTLDLNLPFAEIASQMDRIVETHFSGLTKAC